jgi:release factor glutamine methyltransferase
MKQTGTLDISPMSTLAQAVDHLTATFSAAEIEDSRESAQILVCGAAGLPKLHLLTSPSRSLQPETARKILSYMERRIAREPVSRILGRRDFWNVSLEVQPGVLDPRADTERLIEVCLSRISVSKCCQILDVGVGSGAILCALLTSLSNAAGVGLDISIKACEAARENLQDLGLTERSGIVHCDFTDYTEHGFDLVVSNPPYIRSSEIAGLEPEVALYDPLIALDGGADGLNAYRALIGKLPVWLKSGGVFAVEIGFDQAAPVTGMLRDAGLREIIVTKDYSGLDRVVSGLAVHA